ncbi:YobA family protein [Domibacillus aminovorans]|uniref:YobA family protein n=1 Tax=Domibacillus aminovorans TaxID=29332 RepID=UPI003D1E02F5
MNIRIVYLALSLWTLFLVTGCSNNQDDVNTTNKDSDDYAREIAWDFVKETGWDDGVKEEWQRAKVTKTIADNNYQFLGKAYKDNYEGKEALFVSFEGAPSILIDPNTNKVIGYKLLENPPVKGYIVDKSKDSIWVIPEIKKEEIIGKNEKELYALVMSEKYHGKGYSVDTKDIDKETVTSLQVGQKVVVKFDAFGHSAPRYAHATEIKIVEE